ncbi:DNA mismatch repair protein MLH1, partial [Pancytospora epiphaga]
MKIKKLPDYIVARISAGEVITSPYNVLKELLENSMDVNATRITINLSSTLLSLSVQDNGPGVSREDLKIMCGNHFTSKISGLEDIRRCGTISGLGTFGFRGEALYSIGISGKLCITGKTEGESFGHKASYMGSEVMDIKKVAMDDTGTLVEVTELFYHNVIRRDHFYKNRSECMKCVDMIKSYSCLYSGIRMQVDNKTVFPADMSLKSIKISSEHNDKPTYCLGMTVVDTPSQTDKSTSNPGIIIDDENRRIIENKLDYMTRIFFDSIFIKGKLRHKVTREYFVACTGVNVVLK